MKIFEVKNLDCSKKNNRVLLVKETMKALKIDEKPSKEYLQKVCKKICKKYDLPVKKFTQMQGNLLVSIETEKGSYSTFVVQSCYEMMCKYILFVRAYIKSKKVKAK